MEKEEKVLCRADMKSYHVKMVFIVWYVLAFITFIVLTFFVGQFGTEIVYDVRDGGYNLWGICFYEIYEGEGYFEELLFMLAIAVTVLVILLPWLVHKLQKSIANSCMLTLTEKQIYGQLKTLFGKKQLQMPIEKIDNIMTTNGFMDKLRSGETIRISSNSGWINFHYVQNAEEFVQASLKRIEEVKQAQSVPQPTAAPAASGSDTMEKLNSLKQMLEQGLLTQEEFDEKKKELISKL